MHVLVVSVPAAAHFKSLAVKLYFLLTSLSFLFLHFGIYIQSIKFGLLKLSVVSHEREHLDSNHLISHLNITFRPRQFKKRPHWSQHCAPSYAYLLKMAKMVEKWPFQLVFYIFSLIKFGLKLPFMVKTSINDLKISYFNFINHFLILLLLHRPCLLYTSPSPRDQA